MYMFMCLLCFFFQDMFGISLIEKKFYNCVTLQRAKYIYSVVCQICWYLHIKICIDRISTWGLDSMDQAQPLGPCIHIFPACMVPK